MQRGEFVFAGNAVLVEVSPEARVGVLSAGCVKHAVVVGIEIGERGEAVGGLPAVGEYGVDAEDIDSPLNFRCSHPGYAPGKPPYRGRWPTAKTQGEGSRAIVFPNRFRKPEPSNALRSAFGAAPLS
ncbi:MAG: hypothetical protein LBI87_13865 [Candidatus Accumulibacter sp.]|nr:hypothetical protein [Accumulibacter sp.]